MLGEYVIACPPLATQTRPIVTRFGWQQGCPSVDAWVCGDASQDAWTCETPQVDAWACTPTDMVDTIRCGDRTGGCPV
jgi:hypothetical protein